MKNFAIISIMSFLFSLSTFAVYDPDWMKPVLSASMTLENATGIFQNASQINLTFSKNFNVDQRAELSLSYVAACSSDDERACDLQVQTITLPIISATKDDCGTIEYRAFVGKPNGPRDEIVLLDHSQRTCEDYRSNIWEANVRNGYGWCGTMDSKMHIVGNPEPVYTIL